MIEKRLNTELWRDQKCKAILFDLDGTLIDMHKFVLPLILVPLIWRFRKYSSPKNTLIVLRGSIRKVKNNSSKTINYELLLDHFQSSMKTSRNETSEIFKNLLYKDFPKLRFFFKSVSNANKVIELAKEKGLRVILATNPLFEEEAVKMRMDWGKLNQSPFEYITHNQNSTRCKPNLEYYSFLLKELNLCPDECIMVGNDFTKDLPACDIGLRVLMVHGSINKDKIQIKDHWDYCTGNLKDLKEWLRQF
jgi:FMN phosphatase YigB (HAD superfamily)